MHQPDEEVVSNYSLSVAAGAVGADADFAMGTVADQCFGVPARSDGV